MVSAITAASCRSAFHPLRTPRQVSASDLADVEQPLCTRALISTDRRDVPPFRSPVGARAGPGNAVFGSREVRLARQHALRVANPTVHQR
jgi:hypothetical protein